MIYAYNKTHREARRSPQRRVNIMNRLDFLALASDIQNAGFYVDSYVSESEMTKTITVKGNFCDIVILDEDCIRVGITGKKINVDINGNYCSTSLLSSKEDGFSEKWMVLAYIQENKEILTTTEPELFLFFSSIEKKQIGVVNEEF